MSENLVLKRFALLYRQGIGENVDEINSLIPKLIKIVSPDRVIGLGFASYSSLLQVLAPYSQIRYELLFENNEKPVDCNVWYAHQYFPLYQACASGNYNAARVLLEHGADPNLKHGGLLPILISVIRLPYYRHEHEILELLIKYGANVNSQDSVGDSVLHYVCGTK